MNKEELENERQHYFDLGIMEGKTRFRVIDFIRGLCIGALLMFLALKLLS